MQTCMHEFLRVLAGSFLAGRHGMKVMQPVTVKPWPQCSSQLDTFWEGKKENSAPYTKRHPGLWGQKWKDPTHLSSRPLQATYSHHFYRLKLGIS